MGEAQRAGLLVDEVDHRPIGLEQAGGLLDGGTEQLAGRLRFGGAGGAVSAGRAAPHRSSPDPARFGASVRGEGLARGSGTGGEARPRTEDTLASPNVSIAIPPRDYVIRPRSGWTGVGRTGGEGRPAFGVG